MTSDANATLQQRLGTAENPPVPYGSPAVTRSGDASCCPTGKGELRLRFSNGGLEEVSRPTGTK